MSDYERSYYEIALTNGQVMTVFGVLLAVVFGAFVSGMWVARSALAGDVPAQLSVAAEAPATEAGEKVRFFEVPSDVEPIQPSEAAAGAEPAPERPRGSESQQAAPAQSGRQGRDGVDRDAPPPDTESVRAAARVAEQERQRREEEAARQREAANRPREVDTPQISDLPVIQVLSSGDESQARALVGQLKGAGHRAFISPVQVDGRTMYRVRVGPYSERGQAESAASELKRQFKLDTWITTN